MVTRHNSTTQVTTFSLSFPLNSDLEGRSSYIVSKNGTKTGVEDRSLRMSGNYLFLAGMSLLINPLRHTITHL